MAYVVDVRSFKAANQTGTSINSLIESFEWTVAKFTPEFAINIALAKVWEFFFDLNQFLIHEADMRLESKSSERFIAFFTGYGDMITIFFEVLMI